MVTFDSFIKHIRSFQEHKKDWPEYVNSMRFRFNKVKTGFPGINDDHVDLVSYSVLDIGDIFIYDSNIYGLDSNNTDAPMMLQILKGEFLILGIGNESDIDRDPDRIKFRVGDTINFNLNKDYPIYRVNVRPTKEGGPGYYYFYKAYRDQRE